MATFPIWAALCLVAVAALNTGQPGHAIEPDGPNHEIAGVPVFNYRQNSIMADGDLEWIVMLKESSGMQTHSVCASGKGSCTGEGHPEKGGAAFATFKASEDELAKIVKEHPGEIDFIEQDMLWELPPFERFEDAEESANITLSSEPLKPVGQDSMPMPGTLEEVGLLATERINQGHYVLCYSSSTFTGYGPYRSYQAADIQFNSCTGTVYMTGMNSYARQKSEGNLWQRDPVKTIFETWWKCKYNEVPGSNKCGGNAPAPVPRRRRAPPRRRRAPGPSNPNPRRRRGPAAPVGAQPTNRWGLDRIDQRTGRDSKFGCPLDGTGVHIYVVDTGIRTTHQEFGGRAIPTLETHTGEVKVCDKTDTTCALDTYSHGTHCAGTTGGFYSGVAKNAFIHAVKVMEAKVAYTSRIAKAVDWIAVNGIKPAVLSMSLGAPGKSVAMKIVINKAFKAGMLSVVAAGNLKMDACKQTPAHVESAMTVGATDSADSRVLRYSNFGPCLDIWAPGESILSTGHQSDTQYIKMSGTSMATPHVAGAAALMLQANPFMSPADVDKHLKRESTPDLVKNEGTGSTKLFLYVTQYSTTTSTTTPGTSVTLPPSKGVRRRRRRGGSSRRRRRKNSDAKPVRRRRRRR